MEPLISIVTPALREEENLVLLHERLVAVMASMEVSWEWVIVDDHSLDATYEVACGLAREDDRVRAVRLSRNSGAHVAASCGLELARGEAAVLLAADLQDPPETIPQLFARWRDGAQVVWAVREARPGEKVSTRFFSRLYYALMRRFVGMKDMPSTGADFVLVDRLVIDALNRAGETNVSLFSLITWMGYRQERILYTKEARQHGASKWRLRSKFKLVLDSVTSFSFLPLRILTAVGVVTALVGFIYAAVVLYNRLAGNIEVEGFTAQMIVILILGGMQMLMMGVLGEYLWRALDEARSRPRYMLEADSAREDVRGRSADHAEG